MWHVQISMLDSDEYKGLMFDGWEPFAVALIPNPGTLSIAGAGSKTLDLVAWVSCRLWLEVVHD